jgi:manganese catalase
MILRYDRIAMELPPPSDPDPAGAAAVQELIGTLSVRRRLPCPS